MKQGIENTLKTWADVLSAASETFLKFWADSSEWLELIAINLVGLSILVFDLNPAQQVIEMCLTAALIVYTLLKIYEIITNKKNKKKKPI